jgi:phenylpyruvate tautomerase PptA (4-oxalocrotonate tautomerase family)
VFESRCRWKLDAAARCDRPDANRMVNECRQSQRRVLMPLVRVTMIKGKSPEYIKKMSDSIYQALVEAYGMSENDLFQVIEEPEPGNLIFDRHYGLRGNRSRDFS